MNDKFKILNEYIGDGDPKGRYWFIGVEEATPFYNMEPKAFDAEVNKRKDRKYRPVLEGEIQNDKAKHRSKGEHYTQIYDIMSKFIVGTEGDKWEEYQNKHLLQKGSKEFHMNLFPVGRKSKKLRRSELERFERFLNKLGFNDSSEYERYVRTERFPLMRKFRNLYNPEIIICFGMDNKEDFNAILQLESSYLTPTNSWYYCYPDKRVFITPFFGWGHMSDTKIKMLREKLKKS